MCLFDSSGVPRQILILKLFMKCFQCNRFLDDFVCFRISLPFWKGHSADVSDRVQWKNKIKILITQSCLNPNSCTECVQHQHRHPKNINIYYEDVCIDWAVKWFKVIYAIPIIELHSKEHQCSHNENWKRRFWFIKLLYAATRYWTKRGKVNISLWWCCLAVRKKNSGILVSMTQGCLVLRAWPHITLRTRAL